MFSFGTNYENKHTYITHIYEEQVADVSTQWNIIFSLKKNIPNNE